MSAKVELKPELLDKAAAAQDHLASVHVKAQ